MKKFSWYLPGLLILLFSLTASAQKIRQSYEGSYPEFSLRTGLTSYFDYDAGVMLGIGYRWSNKFSVSLEPTWIFYNGFVVDRNEKIFPSGIKLRADLKYHFPQSTKRSPDFFVGPEFHYKYTETEKEAQFGINCQNGQCAYFQNATYTEVKKEIGALVKLGLLTPLPFVNNDRWLFELYSGLGAKVLKFRETNLPVGGSFVSPPIRTFGSNTDRNTVHLPLIPAGIKLIFVLQKK